MTPSEVRVSIAQLAAGQWGLVTAAQASAAGATRMLLTRMAERGELERVTYGIYGVPAALADEHLEKRALWLSLDPARTAEERLVRRHEAGVLSHATAAALHQIGDIVDARVEITTPRRQQSRRPELRLHRAALGPDEVISVGGLPTTTVSRTIADLVAAGHDRDHVATALADALRQDLATRDQIGAALERRLGADQADEVFAELLTVAGLGEAGQERAVLDSPIVRRAIENVVHQLGQAVHSEGPRDLAWLLPRASPPIEVGATGPERDEAFDDEQADEAR